MRPSAVSTSKIMKAKNTKVNKKFSGGSKSEIESFQSNKNAPKIEPIKKPIPDIKIKLMPSANNPINNK